MNIWEWAECYDKKCKYCHPELGCILDLDDPKEKEEYDKECLIKGNKK